MNDRLYGGWNYDLTKAADFMKAAGWRLWRHMLVIGPIAFCVVWRKRT